MDYPVARSNADVGQINFVTREGKGIQITIHPPSQYVQRNRNRIFPDWQNQPILWVVIILQQSHFPIMEITPQIESEKQKLREIFINFGFELAISLNYHGYPSDIIDPCNGYPLLSHPGDIPHDDIATVKALLHYPIIRNKCRMLIHPKWGACSYPSILISTAEPTLIDLVIKSIAPEYHWRQVNNMIIT